MHRLILRGAAIHLPEDCLVCGAKATSQMMIQDQRLLSVGVAAGGESLMLAVPACRSHKRRHCSAKVASVLLFAASVLIWLPVGLALAPLARHLPEGSMVFGFLAMGIQGYVLLRYGGRWVDLCVASIAIRRMGPNVVELRFKSKDVCERVRVLNQSAEVR